MKYVQSGLMLVERVASKLWKYVSRAIPYIPSYKAHIALFLSFFSLINTYQNDYGSKFNNLSIHAVDSQTGDIFLKIKTTLLFFFFFRKERIFIKVIIKLRFQFTIDMYFLGLHRCNGIETTWIVYQYTLFIVVCIVSRYERRKC